MISIIARTIRRESNRLAIAASGKRPLYRRAFCVHQRKKNRYIQSLETRILNSWDANRRWWLLVGVLLEKRMHKLFITATYRDLLAIYLDIGGGKGINFVLCDDKRAVNPNKIGLIQQFLNFAELEFSKDVPVCRVDSDVLLKALDV